MKKYIKINFVFITAFLFIFSSVYSVTSSITKTNFLINIETNGPCTGYTLISAGDDPAFLIDMDGNVIHNWFLMGFPAKLLPDGSIIGCYELSDIDEAKYIAQEDWDGNIVWEFNNWDNGWARNHHDFEREGNPVGYYAPGQEFIDHGKTLVVARSTVVNKSISLWPLDDEVIYEVDWGGNLTGFEWHANEHFNEIGFDERAKIGIFFQIMPYIMRPIFQGWLHMNSMSELGENHWYDEGDARFNPKNIIIDFRQANFIAIISRETGNIVWNAGPDYSKKTAEGKKLGQIIGQHHAHMIPKGLPGEGNILVFDNGGYGGIGILGLPCRYLRFYSRVIEFNPITYDIVWEYEKKDGPLIPRYAENHRFYSDRISSAQRLPNGNTLICEGSQGRIFEASKEKAIVWEYIYPGNNGSYENNDVYRAYRVPPEWVPGNPAGYDPWE
ncbi:MAG: aryl-sulfate sulfotransferase [Candidatus Thermoplasmatota archaeon]|nr:aryl-sulfate sulfotransferase [Candidatus Thermoplasmatota archaeon]